MTNDIEAKIDAIKSQGYKELGRFENVHGEAYVIFSHHLFHAKLIAGDETDWKILEIEAPYMYAFERFLFSGEETEKIKKIIEKK